MSPEHFIIASQPMRRLHRSIKTAENQPRSKKRDCNRPHPPFLRLSVTVIFRLGGKGKTPSIVKVSSAGKQNYKIYFLFHLSSIILQFSVIILFDMEFILMLVGIWMMNRYHA